MRLGRDREMAARWGTIGGIGGNVMVRQLTLRVSAAVFDELQSRAEARGTSAAKLAQVALETEFRPTPLHLAATGRRLEDHFGVIDLGAPTGADNEAIDRDLAAIYA